MQKTVIAIRPTRDAYEIADVLRSTMTVGKLIAELQEFDEDAPVVFEFFNMHTFGAVSARRITEYEIENDDE